VLLTARRARVSGASRLALAAVSLFRTAQAPHPNEPIVVFGTCSWRRRLSPSESGVAVSGHGARARRRRSQPPQRSWRVRPRAARRSMVAVACDWSWRWLGATILGVAGPLHVAAGEPCAGWSPAAIPVRRRSALVRWRRADLRHRRAGRAGHAARAGCAHVNGISHRHPGAPWSSFNANRSRCAGASPERAEGPAANLDRCRQRDCSGPSGGAVLGPIRCARSSLC